MTSQLSGYSDAGHLLAGVNEEKEVRRAPTLSRDREAMQCPEAGKPIIKFNHCQKYVYSFGVPRRCPLCGQDVGSRRLEEAPVSISEPFTNGHREKCRLLLRPTQGTFLRYSVRCVALDPAGFPLAALVAATLSF